jgi:hypothetical protein
MSARKKGCATGRLTGTGIFLSDPASGMTELSPRSIAQRYGARGDTVE